MRRIPPEMQLETADQQLAMLRALLDAAVTDDEGFCLIQRDHLLDALDKIAYDHARQLAAMPTIAERLMSVFGVTA